MYWWKFVTEGVDMGKTIKKIINQHSTTLQQDTGHPDSSGKTIKNISQHSTALQQGTDHSDSTVKIQPISLVADVHPPRSSEKLSYDAGGF